jgi:GntR family transcriptional repressor for pyruvate dehydrogenase complex
MSRPFETIGRSTVAERVRDDILGRVASGELQPGVQLPAERSLAEQFGVARTSVREAIQALVAIGVIERRGNRSYVVEQLAGSELPEMDGGRKTIRALLEARRTLELTLFELAAARATARERNELLELARRPAPGDLEDFAIVDREFHATIAGACGNPVLVELYGRVLDTLVQEHASASLILGLSEGEDPGSAITAAAADHLRIAQAFVAGDVAGMLSAVEDHLGEVQGRMSVVSRIRRRNDPDPAAARAERSSVGL